MILENKGLQYEIMHVESPIVHTKEVTKSTLDLLSCRRKFHWRVNRKLEPLKKSKTLEIGDLWHAIMAAHYLEIASRQGRLKFHPEREYGSVSDEIDRFMSDSDLPQEEKEEALELCQSLYSIYCEKFENDEERYVVLGVEFRVSAQIPMIPDWKMSGGIDLLLGDRETKELLIGDHKTTTKQRQDHLPRTDLVFQGWDYSAILSDYIGKPVEKIFFNGVRKKMPVFPEPLKSTGALSTEVTPDTTINIFQDALSQNRKMIKNIKDEKLRKKAESIKVSDYMNIMNNLSSREDEDGNSFVWRKFGIVDEDRRRMFWADVASKVMDIIQERRWSTSWDSCESHGSICPYRNLCNFGDSPEILAGYTVREGSMNPSVKRV